MPESLADALVRTVALEAVVLLTVFLLSITILTNVKVAGPRRGLETGSLYDFSWLLTFVALAHGAFQYVDAMDAAAYRDAAQRALPLSPDIAHATAALAVAGATVLLTYVVLETAVHLTVDDAADSLPATLRNVSIYRGLWLVGYAPAAFALALGTDVWFGPAAIASLLLWMTLKRRAHRLTHTYSRLPADVADAYRRVGRPDDFSIDRIEYVSGFAVKEPRFAILGTPWTSRTLEVSGDFSALEHDELEVDLAMVMTAAESGYTLAVAFLFKSLVALFVWTLLLDPIPIAAAVAYGLGCVLLVGRIERYFTYRLDTRNARRLSPERYRSTLEERMEGDPGEKSLLMKLLGNATTSDRIERLRRLESATGE